MYTIYKILIVYAYYNLIGGIFIAKTNIQHIYDKIFKKILTLSSTSVINMINGLFGTDYPLDSSIDYNWTELIDDNLTRTIADTIITVNKCNFYHIEAQMYEDEDIILRIFQYGFGFSLRNQREPYVLKFPESKVIFLGQCKNTPDELTLRLDFGSQGYFDYKVNTLKYQNISVEEINKRKMVILIPFELLRLKELLNKDHSEENLRALKKLIRNDIIGSIQMNLSVGNITGSDAGRLFQLTKLLYEHLYSKYTQMEVIEEMDESIILEYDHLDKLYEEKDRIYKEKDKTYQEKDKTYQEKDKTYQEKDKAYKEKEKDYKEKEKLYQDTDRKLAEAEAEIARLKNEINKLNK